MELIKEHYKVLNEESAISDRVIEESGVFSSDKEESYEKLGAPLSGIMFPYVNFSKELLGYRLRRDEADKGYKYHQKVEAI